MKLVTIFYNDKRDFVTNPRIYGDGENRNKLISYKEKGKNFVICLIKIILWISFCLLFVLLFVYNQTNFKIFS